VCASFGRAQVAAFARGLFEKTRQWQRVAHLARERIVAEGADVAVRIVLGGQEEKLDAARVARVGQGRVQRLARGAPPAPSPSKLKTT